MAKTLDAHPLEGKKAPVFTLASSAQKNIKLSDFKGKMVVLYFYPKDNTPGCTLEAAEFREVCADLEALGAVVLGVSPDSVSAHCNFTQKLNLNFLLLSDTDHAVAEKYGVWVEKCMCGKKYMGIQRTTFLIDGAGKVLQVWPKVKPEGHAKAVLNAIKSAK